MIDVTNTLPQLVVTDYLVGPSVVLRSLRQGESFTLDPADIGPTMASQIAFGYLVRSDAIPAAPSPVCGTVLLSAPLDLSQLQEVDLAVGEPHEIQGLSLRILSTATLLSPATIRVDYKSSGDVVAESVAFSGVVSAGDHATFLRSEAFTVPTGNARLHLVTATVPAVSAELVVYGNCRSR